MPREQKEKRIRRTSVARVSKFAEMYKYFSYSLFMPCHLHPTCSIRRLQTRGNKVNSFLRGCEDKPLVSTHTALNLIPRQIDTGTFLLQVLNGVKSDGFFRTYYRSCQQDLCNGHNGRVYNSSGGGTAGSAQGGGHLNAIIPGKSGCLAAKTGVLWLPLTLLLLLRLLLHSDCNQRQMQTVKYERKGRAEDFWSCYT